MATPTTSTSKIQVLHWRITLRNSPRTSPKKLGLAVRNCMFSDDADVITALIAHLLCHRLSGAGRPLPGPALPARWYRARSPLEQEKDSVRARDCRARM